VEDRKITFESMTQDKKEKAEETKQEKGIKNFW
jgi:hypothetical protein